MSSIFLEYILSRYFTLSAYNPFACSPAISLSSSSLYRALSFSLSSLLLRIPVPLPIPSFHISATLFDDTALYIHAPPPHPPTHSLTHPSRQGCRRGCTRVTELESKSRAIRLDGTVDRSIARSTERTTLESIEQEAANLLVRLQPQSAESAGAANASHPYRMPQMLQEKFADDFPLRKTGTYARPRADTRCYTINSRVVE